MQNTATILPVEALRRAAAAMLASLLLVTGLASAPAAAEGAERLVSVIVQGVSPATVNEAVESVGGTVTQQLPIVQGVSADVPASSVRTVRSMPGVLNVTEDQPIKFHAALDAAKSAHQIKSVVKSDVLWNEGINGSGTTVAVIDTGVYAAHPDLAGRVTCGIDLSHEAGTAANCADTFGHGTFMAGLVAGNGASSGGKYKGVAPGANIVSVKVAGFDGSTDVTHVLAAMQWVVAHKDAYGIDVVSLSLGTDASMDYRLNPLNLGAEMMWKSGIVVVTSSSNRGDAPGTVTSPGDDPYVITVGASNHEGSVSVGDDRVPLFSGRGPTASNGIAKPDVVAPGVSTVSLNSPGSHIDQNYGATAALPGGYFKGTGTSMSTATVAGVVAQMLQADPSLTPDQVKFRLTDTARPIVDTDPNVAGHGVVDAYGAARSTATGVANQNVESSTGLGLLGLSRGSLDVWVKAPLGSVQLTGELTAQTDPDLVDLTNPLGLLSWDGTAYATVGWDATKWTATKWTTEEWTATKWTGATFEATKWTGTKWTGTKWTSADWDATKWTGTDWDATKWTGTKWTSHWYAVAWN